MANTFNMSDVYISYSRKDAEFVKKLDQAFKMEGLEVWIDWEDIKPTEAWMKEIEAGIEGADAFISVMSQDYFASEVCTSEVAHAIDNGKRLIPILYREVSYEDSKIPDTISSINWVFMRDEDDFEQQFATLLRAIKTDYEYTRQHTRLLVRANEWLSRDRDNSFLMRGTELREAQKWLVQSTEKEPTATQLQIEYITTSSNNRNPVQRIFDTFNSPQAKQSSPAQQTQSSYSDIQQSNQGSFDSGENNDEGTEYSSQTQQIVDEIELEESSPPPEPLPLGQARFNAFLHADDTNKRDLLDISADVEALATLIAADNTPLPLAVGIFGKWGSGKTFFMEKLASKIDELSQLPPPPDPNSPRFYENIAQIKFNAWHYVEGNLWAGLVEYIFSELQNLNKVDEKMLLEQELQVHLDEKEAAKSQQNEAQETLDEMKKKLEIKKETLENKQEQFQFKLQQQINLIIQEVVNDEAVQQQMHQLIGTLELNSLQDAKTEVLAAYQEAQASTKQTNNILANIQAWELILLVLFIFAVPTAILILREVNGWQWINDMGVVIGSAIPIIGSITVALRTWTQAQSRIQEKLAKKFDDNQELVTQEALITQLDNQVKTAEATRQSAEAKIEATREKLRALSPRRVLEDFIQDRTASNDYRQHLGIPAVIRRDLEKLSTAIKDYNQHIKSLEPGENESDEQKIELNRIVLYIDDLDRCPPTVVVRVLEAVHLISAFEAFVVVVGVDLYWLQKALNVHIQGMPIDAASYLKKIFQIPLWLLPMSVNATQNYLRGLLLGNVSAKVKQPELVAGSDEIKSDTEAPSELVEELAENTDKVKIDAKASPELVEELAERMEELKQDIVPLPVATRTGIQATTAEQAATNLAALLTNDEEMAFMESLAPIIGSSPREVKRFVNLYRLHKVSHEMQNQNAKDGSSISNEELKIVLTMLAIFVGQDIASDYLIEAIDTSLDNQSLGELLDLAKQRVSSLDDSDEKKLMARMELKNIVDCINITHSYLLDNDVRSWAQRVARYSFEMVG